MVEKSADNGAEQVEAAIIAATTISVFHRIILFAIRCLRDICFKRDSASPIHINHLLLPTDYVTPGLTFFKSKLDGLNLPVVKPDQFASPAKVNRKIQSMRRVPTAHQSEATGALDTSRFIPNAFLLNRQQREPRLENKADRGPVLKLPVVACLCAARKVLELAQGGTEFNPAN